MKQNINKTLPAGSVIGVLGGGQLGRMTALAAAPLGYRCHIFTPEHNSPAAQVAEMVTVASYKDSEALTNFANNVDIITYEFENIPLSSVTLLERLKIMRPSSSILAISQHRGDEKGFAIKHGITVAPYKIVTNIEELHNAIKIIGIPSVLKTCRFGYDGKGQFAINEPEDVDRAWHLLESDDLVLEKFITYTKEISVIVARDINGNCKTYSPGENQHLEHILDTTVVPANISAATSEAAKSIALKLAESMNLIGLLAVEMFVMANGTLMMNEIAPRPHNSGHWTQDGAHTSQFEQFVRAITGQPLSDTKIISSTIMKNLIGTAVNQLPDFFNNPNAKIHLYGKTEIRPGRKMGHVNILKTKSAKY